MTTRDLIYDNSYVQPSIIMGYTRIGASGRHTTNGNNSPKVNGVRVLQDNPYTASHTYRNSPLVYTTDGPHVEYLGLSAFGGVTCAMPAWSPVSDLKLINKLADLVPSHELNVGVFLAEAPMAVQMIGQRLYSFANGLFQLRKGNISGALRAWGSNKRLVKANVQIGRTFSEAVLEVQYGWRPLFQDIYGASQLLDSLVKRSFKTTIRVRASQACSLPISDNLNVWDITTKRASFRKQITAHLSGVDSIGLMGLTDPLPILWEMLPGSFLIDWLLPIGSWLSANQLSRNVKGKFVTTETFKASAVGVTPMAGYNGYRILTGSGSRLYELVTVSRTVGTVLPVPQLPSFKPLAGVAGVQHCLNALALLTPAILSWDHGPAERFLDLQNQKYRIRK